MRWVEKLFFPTDDTGTLADEGCKRPQIPYSSYSMVSEWLTQWAAL
jgi:hypothetical protein